MREKRKNPQIEICGLSSPDIRGHEQRALNYLVNEYLLQRGHKITSITFSEENGDQDFEEWDEEGARERPPSLLRLYRDYGRHVAPKKVSGVYLGVLFKFFYASTTLQDLHLLYACNL